MSRVLHVSQTLAAVAGPVLEATMSDVVQRSGRCRLGLSGGSTPEATLRWLADHLDASLYPRLWITWVDERMTGDERSRNDALARRAWLDRVAPPGCVLPMTHTGDLPGDAARYTRAFDGAFGGLDLVLLGAGPDGHFASLFPGHPGLDATGTCVAISDSPKPPADRLSLTRPVLEAVDCAVLLARGGAKAEMLGRAWRGDADLPLGRYAPRGAYHWIIDPAAASEVTAGNGDGS